MAPKVGVRGHGWCQANTEPNLCAEDGKRQTDNTVMKRSDQDSIVRESQSALAAVLNAMDQAVAMQLRPATEICIDRCLSDCYCFDNTACIRPVDCPQSLL